jgi:adenine-specific DNA-methyltransferase
MSQAQQTEIAEIVNKILTPAKADHRADTLKLEREIDSLVYGLYALVADEIAIVEGKA